MWALLLNENSKLKCIWECKYIWITNVIYVLISRLNLLLKQTIISWNCRINREIIHISVYFSLYCIFTQIVNILYMMLRTQVVIQAWERNVLKNVSRHVKAFFTMRAMPPEFKRIQTLYVDLHIEFTCTHYKYTYKYIYTYYMTLHLCVVWLWKPFLDLKFHKHFLNGENFGFVFYIF